MKTANPPKKSVERDANFSHFLLYNSSFLRFHFKLKSMVMWIIHLPLEIHFLLFMAPVKMADSGQRYASRWNGDGVVKNENSVYWETGLTSRFSLRTHIRYSSARFVKWWIFQRNLNLKIDVIRTVRWPDDAVGVVSVPMFRPETHLPGWYQRLCRHHRR